jgi:hypothetical protein
MPRKMAGWVGNSNIHAYDEAYWSTTDEEDEVMNHESEWTFEEPTDSDILDWEDTDGDVWRREGDRWFMYASPATMAWQPRWKIVPEGNRRRYEWWELKDNNFLPFRPADNSWKAPVRAISEFWNSRTPGIVTKVVKVTTITEVEDWGENWNGCSCEG